MSLSADSSAFVGESVTLGKKGQQITLTFSVSGLPAESNPVVGVFDKQGKIIGRTEWVKNSASPKFAKKFVIMHANTTPLTLSVYNASSSVSATDYLGGVSIDLKNMLSNGGKNDVTEGGVTFHFTAETPKSANGDAAPKPKAEKQVDPKVAAALKEKLLAKCQKEGGKKAQDIAGLRDMGGVSYFHVSIDACEGDWECLERCMIGMNTPCPEDAEERTGGADEIGKVLMSYNDDKLALYMHVPKNLSECSIDEWFDAMVVGYKVTKISGDKEFIKAEMAADQANGIYPIKVRDVMINNGYQHLAAKRLVMPDDDGDEDCAMGDDDFYI